MQPFEFVRSLSMFCLSFWCITFKNEILMPGGSCLANFSLDKFSLDYLTDWYYQLTESQISILADYYSNRYDAWSVYGNLCEAISKHGNERKYFIYKSYIKEVGKTLKSSNKTFHCEINKNNNELLLGDLNRHLHRHLHVNLIRSYY